MEPIIDFLKTGLDGAQLRQKAISNNIANVDTPKYKRKDVDFQKQLESAVKNQNKNNSKLKLTHPGHRPGRKSNINFEMREESGNYRNDENNVDVDVEMAELAKNQLYYNTLSQQLGTKFNQLGNVIDKGGRS